jgi:hypothetical protein
MQVPPFKTWATKMAKIGRRSSMITSFPPVVQHQARGYAQGIKGCLSVHFEPRIIEDVNGENQWVKPPDDDDHAPSRHPSLVIRRMLTAAIVVGWRRRPREEVPSA